MEEQFRVALHKLSVPPPKQIGAQLPTELFISLTPPIHLPSFLSRLIPLLVPLAPRSLPREGICMQIIVSKSFLKINYIGGTQMERVIQRLPSLFV